MNIISNSKLPYIKIQNCVILFDSGSSVNLISPKLLKIYNLEKIPENSSFNTAQGKFNVTHYVNFELNKQKFKCYIYDFHRDFNLLLGTDVLIKLGITLNFKNQTVTINNQTRPLKYFESSHCYNQEINKIPIRTDHLNPEEKRELLKLINKYIDILPNDKDPLTFTDTIEHKIITQDETPVYTGNNRYPEIYKEKIKRQTQKLLDDKVIRPSHSP